MNKSKPTTIADIMIIFLIGFIFFNSQEGFCYNAIKRTYDLPHDDLAEKIILIIKDPPLSLNIDTIRRGLIITDYENYDGETHGLFWWERRWEERTRYMIEIYPHWDSENKCLLSISTETEHRPNANYPWERVKSESANKKTMRMLRIIDDLVIYGLGSGDSKGESSASIDDGSQAGIIGGKSDAGK